MTKRQLSDWEKVQARADYVAKRGKQFSTIEIASVRVEDWTDDHGKPVVNVESRSKPSV